MAQTLTVKGRVHARRRGIARRRVLAPVRLARGGPVWWVALALAIAALLAQAFLFQTHVHPAVASAAQAVVSAHSPDTPSHWAAIADIDDCPLCQAQALGGAWLVPPSLMLVAPLPAGFMLLAGVPVAAACRWRSHDWHSRAPPVPA